MSARSRILLALLASALCAAACRSETAARDSAEAFVRRAYLRYAEGEPKTLTDDAASLFAPDLLALIREDQRIAQGEVGLLGHDPLCACQDWEALRVTEMEVEIPNPGVAKVRVAFSNAGQPTRVGLSLVKLGDEWRIRDVEEPGVPSLARYLRDGLAPLRGPQP